MGLKVPLIRVPPPGPKARAIIALDERYIATPTKTAPGKRRRKVFFTNSGTESTEAAIKLARHNTRRGLFLAFLKAFHGRSMGSLALTASKPVHRRGYAPMLPSPA